MGLGLRPGRLHGAVADGAQRGPDGGRRAVHESGRQAGPQAAVRLVPAGADGVRVRNLLLALHRRLRRTQVLHRSAATGTLSTRGRKLPGCAVVAS